MQGFKVVTKQTAPDLFFMLENGDCKGSEQCAYKPYRVKDLCVKNHLKPILKSLAYFIARNKIRIANYPLEDAKSVIDFINSSTKPYLCNAFKILQTWCKENAEKCKELHIPNNCIAPGLFGTLMIEGNVYDNASVHYVDEDKAGLLAYVKQNKENVPDEEASQKVHGFPFSAVDGNSIKALLFEVPIKSLPESFICHFTLEGRNVKPGKPCRKGDPTCWNHQQLAERATELGYSGSLSASKATLAIFIQAVLDCNREKALPARN